MLQACPEVNILVCDDGLQHWALHRDLQVVVFDDRGTGNGWLLPAGLLRESWPRSSSVEEIVLLQHREDAPAPMLVIPHQARQFHAARRLAAQAIGPDGELVALHALHSHRITAVAGIARPAVFFEMLRAAGLEPQHEVALPDHAEPPDYTALLRDQSGILICTEKDAVKLRPLLARVPAAQRMQVWSVPLELKPDPAFFSALTEQLQKLGRKPSSSAAR